MLVEIERAASDLSWVDSLYLTVRTEAARKPATVVLRNEAVIEAAQPLANCPALLIRGSCRHRLGHVTLGTFSTGLLCLYAPRLVKPADRGGSSKDLAAIDERSTGWAMAPWDATLALGQSIGALRTATDVRGVLGDVADRVRFDCPKSGCPGSDIVRADTLVIEFCSAVARGAAEFQLESRPAGSRTGLKAEVRKDGVRVYRTASKRRMSPASQRPSDPPKPLPPSMSAHRCTLYCVRDVHVERIGPLITASNERIRSSMVETHGVKVTRIENAPPEMHLSEEGKPPARLLWFTPR